MIDTAIGYTLIRTLFRSTRTVIHEATRQSDGRRVVLKVLNTDHPTREAVARLRREYRITQALSIRGVIQALAVERFGSSVALVLDYGGGNSLASHLTGRPLAVGQALRVAVHLAEILGQIHRRGVIHKDINPSNIIWYTDRGELEIIDFGIATELSREAPTIATIGVLEGTLAYIAPEATGRMNRTVDSRSDIYSFGATLYELFTGQPPFVASDPMELVHSHIARMPVPPHEVNPDLPRPISEIILCALSKLAEDRYQSAFAMQADLARCLDEFERTRTISSFPLREGDVPERIQLPQKLYGRSKQIQMLLDSFERVDLGTKEVVLIAGYSGIGKSALVNEIHKPILRRRGYFISGKFDQFNRDIPYAPLIQTARDLIRQILTESPEQLALWRNRLHHAVGVNGQVAVDVLPDLEFILGKQPPVPSLSAKETQNRFTLVFEQLFRSFAGPDHPLVLFLDDLQWADLPSLAFFERIMTDEETMHFLLVGAYRDNAVGPSHPLMLALAAMTKAGTQIRTATLDPLSHADIVDLLVDVLHSHASRVEPLATLCLQKTGGNPFFLGQFLLSLQDEHLLVFDAVTKQFVWDVEAIARAEMTDNVVELMAGKIRKLNADAQRVLRLAACIGNRFDLRTLATADERPLTEAAAALWSGLREGLILPLGDGYKYCEGHSAAPMFGAESSADEVTVTYRFLHDRVQQAAYSLIPDDQKERMHLHIGRLLRDGTPPAQLPEHLFAIIGQLNRGLQWIEAQDEREQVARLNLLGGRKAQASAAHDAALEYFQAGIALVGPHAWDRLHDLCLDLHLGAASANQLGSHYDKVAELADVILAHVDTPLSKARIYEIRIDSLIAQHRLLEATQVAREILAMLGIFFPDKPGGPDVAAGLTQVAQAIADRTVESLIDLPEMHSLEKLAAIRILARISSVAYIGNPALFPLVVLQQVLLSVQYGNTGASAFGYATYGILLCGPLGNIDAGYAFGNLATAVIEKYNAKEYEARTLYVISSYIRHWKEHVRTSCQAMRDHYQVGLETGDTEFAAWSLMMGTIQGYWMGTNLGEMENKTAVTCQRMMQLDQRTALQPTQAILQSVRNLHTVVSTPWRLSSDEYNEDRMLAIHLEEQDVFGACHLLTIKLQLAYLFGQYHDAVRIGNEIVPLVGSMTALSCLPVYYVFDTLARLALCRNSSSMQQEEILAVVDAALVKLRAWETHGSMNHGHRRALVEAELARLRGHHEDARRAYYQAMQLARAHEYLHDEALAAELFAEFLRECDEIEVARLFGTKARNLYHLWGANTKVADLDRRHPEWIEIRDTAPAKTTASLDRLATRQETTGSVNELNYISVIKVSQAISSEITLPGLIEKFLQIMVENAGARRGVLIVEGDPSLVATLDCTQEKAALVMKPASSAETPVPYAQTVVRYVQRTGESVVLDNASKQGPFQSDAYIVEKQSRSILCMPIRQQKQLIAVLYMENDLVASAFGEAHREVLAMLGAQAAISLENAKLYDTLETRVARRTQELQEALTRLQQLQQQLVLQEKLASLGGLVSGIAHEMRNPLNFINNFAHINTTLVEDLRTEVDGQKARIEPEARAEIDDILGHLQKNTVKIGQQGQRAEQVVKRMLEHAHVRTGSLMVADINEVVRQYIDMAVVGKKMRIGEPLPLDLHTSFDTSIPPLSFVPEDIGRVIVNLVENALDALHEKRAHLGEHFMPRLEIATKNANQSVVISLRDNGPGISVAVRDKLFTPFYTTKPAGQGTGLGLSISHEIVTQGHGGTLSVRSTEGSFTEFVVVLPKQRSISDNKLNRREMSP